MAMNEEIIFQIKSLKETYNKLQLVNKVLNWMVLALPHTIMNLHILTLHRPPTLTHHPTE